jgi:hypothetical protein
VLQAAKDFAGARAQFDEALRLYESIHDLRGQGRTKQQPGRAGVDAGELEWGPHVFLSSG